MPRPGLPPTPASSTDIKGKDGSGQLAGLQLSFELPPPAITAPAQDGARISPAANEDDDDDNDDDDNHKPGNSGKSPAKRGYPVQASEVVKARRRSSAAQKAAAQEPFTLPPPPTRSRKIIQMKPRTSDDAAESASSSRPTPKATSTAGAPAALASTAGVAAAGPVSRKKQPSATSAAGRKIARKTAHSLIERRRRSKMNEEFAVLKNMIPACTGEMHKLAILQVGSRPDAQGCSVPPVLTLSTLYRRLLNTCDISRTVSPSSRPTARANGLSRPASRPPPAMIILSPSGSTRCSITRTHPAMLK